MRRTYNGSCHCGRVTFELTASMTHVMYCNCSLCRRVGALWHGASDASFRALSGESELGEYRFNTGAARHFFSATAVCIRSAIRASTRPGVL